MAQVSICIARDRKRAGFCAGIVVVVVAAAFAAFLFIASFATQYFGISSFVLATSVTVVLAAVGARWNYQFIHGAFMRPRIQAIWMRRFQAEGGRAFRTSRVIDGLARYGISTLTLQDRDVRLSLEQRHQRLAPIFWASSIPLVAGLGYLSFPSWQAAFRSTTADGFNELGALFIVVEAWVVIAFILIGAIGVAVIAGPLETLFRRHRDDYPKLPCLVRRVTAGRRKRGAVVLRISDSHWREAVTAALNAVDVAIVDLSVVTDHIAWEIRETVTARGAAALVFICRENSGGLSPQAMQVLHDVRGTLAAAIVYYPETRSDHRKGEEFAVALREAIYVTVDGLSPSSQPRPSS